MAGAEPRHHRSRLAGRGFVGSDPGEGAGEDPVPQQRRLRADDDLAPRGIDREHVERLGRSDTEAAALAYGEMDDALVAAEDPPRPIHDGARLRSAGAKPLDHAGIAA